VSNVDFKLTKETANGVFLTTMWDWVYAVNADTGAWEWATDLMRDNSGGYVQQPCHMTDGHCDNTGWLARGVNSTAVIDPGANEMYVLFSTRLKLNIPVNCDPSNDMCRYQQHLVEEADINYWLVVLRLNDGVELRRVRVGAQATKSDGSRLSFDDRQELDRPGLLLDHGSIYIAFGANAGIEGRAFYHGWVIRYQAKGLAFQGAFCTSVNSERGSGIWQGGGGLAADPTDSGGSVYFLTGNGPANSPSGRPPFIPAHPNPPKSFGDSFIKLTPSGGRLTPTAFVPDDADRLEAGDADLGAGGAMMIPDTDIVIGGGKTGYLYVLDRRSMKLQQWFPASTNQYEPSSRDQDWDVGPHLHGSPTYWRGADPNFGNLYIWGEKDFLKLYRFDMRNKKFEEKGGTRLTNPPVVPGTQVVPFLQGSIQALGNTMPGGIMSISANGNTPHTGILWATLPVFDWPKSGPFPGRLYAFDAENLNWLWDAGWNGGLAHWVPPTVGEGKVFQATSDKLIMYGLCAPEKPCRPSGPPFQPKSVWNVRLTLGSDLGVVT
jgi:hypothetical protein